MSVLLDALKKAAEEKKNAEKEAEKISFSDNDSISQTEIIAPIVDDPIKIKKDEKSVLSIENESTEYKAELENDSELPIFNLKIATDDVSHNESILNPSIGSNEALNVEKDSNDGLKLSLQSTMLDDEVTPKNNENPLDFDAKEFDLNSLIDSLDTDISATDNSSVSFVTLKNDSHQSPSLSIESNSVSKESIHLVNTEDVNQVYEADPTQDQRDASWNVDNLPSYTELDDPSEILDKKNSKPVNPVLLNTGNTVVEPKSKYITSSRIMVSLIVVLFFIGIGFYGMLYYQEQNDSLENSMRKYNLSKMKLSSPEELKNTKPTLESFEDPTALNIVSDKVIELGNSIKDSVQTNVIDPLTNNQSSNNLAFENVQLEEKNIEAVSDDSGNETSQSVLKKDSLKSQQTKITKPIYRTSMKTTPKHQTASSGLKDLNRNKSVENKIVLTGSIRSGLGQAYSEYESRNFTKAELLFNEVLKKEPKNINALLGLGGVSVAKGQYRTATGYYQRVLNIEPSNLYAFEAIANLSSHLDLNKSWESELNEMLTKYPNSAVLQYAKGNIAAKDNDWLLAQKHYFEAYAADTSNPDYMMNLAVSFDHLGKYTLAAEYYLKSLAYADYAKVSFDKEQVKSRLISIRQFTDRGQ